jgi:hypothetical protein
MADNPFSITSVAPQVPRTAGTVVQSQRGVAEIQARYLLARANPRDPLRATDLILQDCTRPTLAEHALYAFNRGGTDISGPSIRLMEAIAARWGNLSAGIKEVARHQGYSECLAYAHDLETGYYEEREFTVRHWRDTKKGGYATTDERDILEATASMAQRRKRACLQAVIPGDVVEAAVAQCEQTLRASADTSPEAIKKMLETFGEIGITKQQIEVRCQRRAEAIRPAQMVMLRRIYTSLRDEMSEPADWFDPTPATESAESSEAQKSPPPAAGSAGLEKRLRTRRQARQQPDGATGDATGGVNASSGVAGQSLPNTAPETHIDDDRRGVIPEEDRKTDLL